MILNVPILQYLEIQNIPSVTVSESPKYTIGYDDTKYQKEITYNGWFFDLYLLNIITGQETLIDDRLEEQAHISPNGDYVVYFKDNFWYIYFSESGNKRQLTDQLPSINFYNEEWDIPADPPSYGFGGFYKGKRSGFLIYDKYDIWQIEIKNESINAFNLTDALGREYDITFRPVKLDRKQKYYEDNDTILISAFHNKKKWKGIYEMQISLIGPLQMVQEDGYTFDLLRQSEDKKKILFSKENFAVFPDLWVAPKTIDTMTQVSHLGKQTEDFLWGYTEVISWQSEKGDSLQGYLIKPDNYDPDKKYPLIVFFYEQMSDRAFTFWQPRIFHLISYPNYFPDDYMFLLPDIKYYEGNPGFDALDAINSGCQYLIDEGVVDADKIGLQGHSWSAYQAAFMITKTDMYAAAVIGAPVGNMTSAYSGIRTGSGLARQFQYEKYQSRIGGNLWDSLDNYLNNSPVFTAQDANTPMLIYHGTVDEAVPFSQGVELFLAFRRLGKETILLEYTGEPHHPRKYENKLDYAIRMKEFYDHFLLGKPAPEWIIKGSLYKGK
jgi:dienelactone hydrolase